MPTSVPSLPAVRPSGRVLIVDDNAELVDTLRAVIASGVPGLAIGALRSGAFAFVLKSFRPEELISIVEQALGKVQLKREREELERRYRDLVELTDVLVVAIDDGG